MRRSAMAIATVSDSSDSRICRQYHPAFVYLRQPSRSGGSFILVVALLLDTAVVLLLLAVTHKVRQRPASPASTSTDWSHSRLGLLTVEKVFVQ